MSWRSVEPSPFRAWVRSAPKAWPAPPFPYLDLATGRIVWPSPEGAPEQGLPPEDALPPATGPVYLPPVAERLERAAARVALRLRRERLPVVRHRFAGVAPDAADDLEPTWLDPLEAWWASIPADSWSAGVSSVGEGSALAGIAWPLVAGWSPTGQALDAWLAALASLRPLCVVGIAVAVEPADRRRLVEQLGEERFDALFHGRPMGEREFARAAARRGLNPLPPWPREELGSPRVARQIELAACLREVAELGARLGASEAESAAYFAAARHLEATTLDLAALAREGNLGVVDWLPAAVRRDVEQWLERGSSERLDELRARWGEGSAA